MPLSELSFLHVCTCPGIITILAQFKVTTFLKALNTSKVDTPVFRTEKENLCSFRLYPVCDSTSLALQRMCKFCVAVCRFPSEYFGILYGLMIILSGVVGMAQFGLLSWAEASGYYVVSVFLSPCLVLLFDLCVKSFSLCKCIHVYNESNVTVCV